MDNALPAETTPEEAYKSFEDFFVNGMACDRTNTLISNNENSVSWQQTRNIHVKVRANDGELLITNPAPFVLEVLEMTGFSEMLNIQ